MDTLLDKLLEWYVPPTPRVAFNAGQIARGLADLRSVGCRLRSKGMCPYTEKLFGCADCTLEGAGSVLPPLYT